MAQQTTLDEWAKDPLVDPEIRAHVYSLISALGGIGEDGTYALGDDAILCLKDLRKWLKFADGQLNRRDVARCMAEANLVKGDLLEILAKISERIMHDKLKHKIAVAVLELLVPLTWPFEIDPLEATVNHHRHGPYIQLAQIGYKRAVLQFDRARILQTAVRIALPSMAISMRERTPRDEGIIRIALYFIRNIAMLSPPNNIPMDVDEAEVSRSATIETFYEQDIFQVILSVASSIGEDFLTQDVVILETLFYLLKGIDAEKLFMEDRELNSKNTNELKELMQKEKAMLAGYTRHAPTRHNRFGTMIWLKRDDEKVSTISGQDVLGKAQRSMQKMDYTKKWNKPKRTGRRMDEGKHESEEFNLPVALTLSARKHIKAFVEEFLDSSFNPLFLHLRKALERETERIETRHCRQYFYLASWFLRAECARRRTIKDRAAHCKSNEAMTTEGESYGLIAEVMNQETFILLNRFMQKSQDEKAWQDLNAGMRCLTQILLTVQEMSDSVVEDDQEIAENIQNRIFYEESTHDRVVGILRCYKDQGFGYLDAVTELSHVFLRMLERYSKQNVDLQVRSKRRTRKIQKKAMNQGEENEEEGNVSATEDITTAQRVISERKFDFARFAAKFVNQSSVDTFVAFTRFYNELSSEQLKRAHRFFYRVAFKMEIGVLLFRVDILQLFNKMIKGPEGLDPDFPSFKEWDEFIRHFFRTVVKRIQERPELVVEMLFNKIPATIFYLEHGYERDMPTRTPRAPVELVVKPGLDKPEQIGVIVGVLVNQQKSDALRWVRDVLSSAIEERKAWEEMEETRRATAILTTIEGEAIVETTEESEPPKPPSILIKPNNEEHRIAMFKDNKLRLLMTLVGFTRLGEENNPDASWLVPSSLAWTDLQQAIDLIRKYEFDPPVYDDGKRPEDMLRSKAVVERRSTRRVDFDDDSDGKDPGSDHGEYAIDGPTTRKPDGSKNVLKRRRRERTPVVLDDKEKETRAEARRKKELEKQRKIKSTIYVHDSDDEEWDEEREKMFYDGENKIREFTIVQYKKSIGVSTAEPPEPRKRKADEQSKKRLKRRKTPRREPSLFDTGGREDNHIYGSNGSESESESEETGDVAEADSGDEDETTNTPLSSQHATMLRTNDVESSLKPIAMSKNQNVISIGLDDEDDEDDEDDDAPVVRRPIARGHTRAGFVISDSE